MMKIIEKIAYYLAYPAIAIALCHTNRTRLVIFYKDELLVLRGRLSNGRWILPGGGIHKNENANDAVIREVFEETGVTLDKSDINKSDDILIRHRFISFTATFFYITLHAKPELSLQWYEIADARWVRVAQISGLKMDEAEKQTVLSLIAKGENGTLS